MDTVSELKNINYICISCKKSTTFASNNSIVCKSCGKRIFSKEAVKIPITIKAL